MGNATSDSSITSDSLDFHNPDPNTQSTATFSSHINPQIKNKMNPSQDFDQPPTLISHPQGQAEATIPYQPSIPENDEAIEKQEVNDNNYTLVQGLPIPAGSSQEISPYQQCLDYLEEKKAENTFVLSESNRRNIIFIGKTRSGKSTAINGLKNPYVAAGLPSIFSDPSDAHITHFTVETANPKEEGGKTVNYNINIIDTPGLFEISKDGKERDEETLANLICKCMNAQITQIHAIYFVIACGTAINPQDIASLARFIRLFAGAEKIMHVLLTRSEDLDELAKSKFVDELKSEPAFSSMLQFTNKRFHFFGALSHDCVTQGSEDMVQLLLPRILQMRQELFQSIFDSDEPFHLMKLAKTGSMREKTIRFYDSLVTTFNQKPLQDKAQFTRNLNTLSAKIPVMTTPWAKTMRAFVEEAKKYLSTI